MTARHAPCERRPMPLRRGCPDLATTTVRDGQHGEPVLLCARHARRHAERGMPSTTEWAARNRELVGAGR